MTDRKQRYTAMLTDRNRETEPSVVEYVRWVFNDTTIKSSEAAVWMSVVKSNNSKAIKRFPQHTRARIAVLHERECSGNGYSRYAIRKIHRID